MSAPRRPDLPMQEPDRHFTQRNPITKSNEPNEKRREGLVGRNGGFAGQAEQTLKAMFGEEQPRSTVATRLITTSSPEGRARAETESLPGQNQRKPSLAPNDAKIEAPVLPGINQDTSNMGEAPKPASPVMAADAQSSTDQPAVMADKPLPGQNQVMPPPAPGPAASGTSASGTGLPASSPTGPPKQSGTSAPGPPPVAAAAPAPPAPPPSAPPMETSLATSLSTTSNLAITTSSAPFTISESSQPLSLPLVTSFVTLTRSEQGKENLPPTLALSSTQPSSTARATMTAAAQAVTVAQSLPAFFSSTGAIAAASSTSAATTYTQDGSILHPTMRTLLIIFVILGVLSIVIAIIIYMMIRSHRRRRAQAQAMRNQGGNILSNRIGVTTHITSDANDNPFLTASEKAIVNRAASHDGASEVHNSSKLTDAVNSFVEKSRSLTYKISP